MAIIFYVDFLIILGISSILASIVRGFQIGKKIALSLHYAYRDDKSGMNINSPTV
jgi:hypothetical protein